MSLHGESKKRKRERLNSTPSSEEKTPTFMPSGRRNVSSESTALPTVHDLLKTDHGKEKYSMKEDRVGASSSSFRSNKTPGSDASFKKSSGGFGPLPKESKSVPRTSMSPSSRNEPSLGPSVMKKAGVFGRRQDEAVGATSSASKRKEKLPESSMSDDDGGSAFEEQGELPQATRMKSSGPEKKKLKIESKQGAEIATSPKAEEAPLDEGMDPADAKKKKKRQKMREREKKKKIAAKDAIEEEVDDQHARRLGEAAELNDMFRGTNQEMIDARNKDHDEYTAMEKKRLPYHIKPDSLEAHQWHKKNINDLLKKRYAHHAIFYGNSPMDVGHETRVKALHREYIRHDLAEKKMKGQ